MPGKGKVSMKKMLAVILALTLILPMACISSSAEYAGYDRLDGCENIFLSYTFNCNNWSYGRRTVEGYEPLVGYYDTDGDLIDTFFDTFLFLPCVTTTPSGGRTYRDHNHPSNFSDWQAFVDDVFLDGYNIKALNEAVGDMKAQLGEEYQYDWLFNSVDQLWGYSPNAGNVVKKTIYDPCPYGYRVPDDEVDVLFDHCRGQWDEHIQTSDYGITLKGATDIGTAMNNFFPYSGWRGRDVGRTDRDNTWYMVGTLGDYQNARIDKNPASKTYNHRGRTLLVKGGRITIPNPETTYSQYMNTGEHGNRASAAPVRCVRYGSGPEQEP